MDKEIWKDITINGNEYVVSNKGRIAKKLNMSYSHPSKRPESKYAYINTMRNGKTKKELVHRIVACAFVPNPENKPIVNHIDGNKMNNSAENLEWCEAKENTQHAIKNKLSHVGEKSSRSKFSDEQIKQIRKEYIPNSREYGGYALARKYKVNVKTMHKIIKNLSYKNI